MLQLSFYCLFPTVAVLYLLRKFRERQWGKCENNVKLSGKIVIVTGANSGIGFEIAKELAKRGAHVIVACRSLERANNAIDLIKKETACNISIVPLLLDLASLKSIKNFAEKIKSSYNQVDILVNNAGVSFPVNERHVTADGFEMHFGVNHLAHFYLTKLLLDQLHESSRVVVVASALFEKGEINLDCLNNLDPKNKTKLYANSKLANVYFCREFAKRNKNRGIKIYAACPGWVYTGLFRHSIRWYHYILVAPIALLFMRSPKQGSQTPLYCATEPKLKNETGLIYRDCKPYKSKFHFDDNISARLWDMSEDMIKKIM